MGSYNPYRPAFTPVDLYQKENQMSETPAAPAAPTAPPAPAPAPAVAETPKSVTLTLGQWQAVAELMELGIKTAGARAFVPGGQLFEEIIKQVNAKE